VLGAPCAVRARSTHDEQQQLIAQIPTNKRAIVLKTMGLDDAQLLPFTPLYDKYQVHRSTARPTCWTCTRRTTSR
jgi:hypothetical protein